MRTEYSRLWSMNIDYRKTDLCNYCRSHMYCVKVKPYFIGKSGKV
jgi:hypothetical protein